jgi:hypothetical protein
MPDIQPIGASGRFDRKRPRSIPKNVQEAISLMVVGKVDDPDCTPLDFVQAATAVGLKPFVLRRHLEKPHVRAYLLAEKRAFNAMVCLANPAALQRIRDKSVNGMAVVASVRALEQLDEEGTGGRTLDPKQQPGVTIRVVTVVQQAPATPPTISIKPAPRTIEHDREAPPRP